MNTQKLSGDHVDAARVSALLAGTLSQEDEQRLLSHLSADDCDVCQAALDAMPPEVEARLLGTLARADVGAERYVASRPQLPERRQSRSWFWGLGFSLAGAAAAAALALVLLMPGAQGPVEPEGQRIKAGVNDTGLPGTVSLSLGVVAPRQDGTQAITGAREGEHVPANRSVVFELSAEGPDACYLTHVDGAGQVEILAQPGQNPIPQRAARGDFRDVLSQGGKPLGQSLSDLRGQQHWVAVCARKPLAEQELQTLARALATGQAPDPKLPVSFDRVTLVIDPEDPAK